MSFVPCCAPSKPSLWLATALGVHVLGSRHISELGMGWRGCDVLRDLQGSLNSGKVGSRRVCSDVSAFPRGRGFIAVPEVDDRPEPLKKEPYVSLKTYDKTKQKTPYDIHY